MGNNGDNKFALVHPSWASQHILARGQSSKAIEKVLFLQIHVSLKRLTLGGKDKSTIKNAPIP